MKRKKIDRAGHKHLRAYTETREAGNYCGAEQNTLLQSLLPNLVLKQEHCRPAAADEKRFSHPPAVQDEDWQSHNAYILVERNGNLDQIPQSVSGIVASGRS